MRSRIHHHLPAVVIALSLLACSTPSPRAQPPVGASASTGGSQTYTFGVMIPLTGPAAQIGENYRSGIDLAVERINAEGGVAGMRLQANIQDHKATAQGGAEAANQLINIDRVPYIVSSFSAPALTAQPVAAQNHVLILNVGGADPSLLNRDYLYVNQLMANELLPALADYHWSLGRRSAALLVVNDPYGQAVRSAFRASWEQLGGQIVGDEIVPFDTKDFTAQLTKIRSAAPDLLMLGAFGQTLGLMVKQARASGLTIAVSSALGSDDILTVAGDAANGFVDNGIASDPNTMDPFAAAFFQTFQQKYARVPDWEPGTMYEAVYFLHDLAAATVRQGKDPRDGTNLLAALQARPEFRNALMGGTVQILPDHSVRRPLRIREIRDGKFVPVKIVQPTS